MLRIKDIFTKLIHSEKDPFKVPWGFKDIIFIIILFNILMIPAVIFEVKDNSILDQYIYSSVICISVLAYLKFRFKIKLNVLGIKTDMRKDIINGFIFGAIAFLIVKLLSPDLFRLINSFLKINKFAAILGIPIIIKKAGILDIILMPFSEELLMRGVLYPVLRKKLNILYSVLICSLIFAALHMQLYNISSFSNLFNVFLVSILFSLTYEKYRTIFIPTIAHSFYNFLLVYSSFLVVYVSKH